MIGAEDALGGIVGEGEEGLGGNLVTEGSLSYTVWYCDTGGVCTAVVTPRGIV